MRVSLLVVLAAMALVTFLQAPAAHAASNDKPTKACRYRKGQWTACDPTTKTRSRTLTLKAGDKATCEPTRTLTKECSKACRYEKGAWGPCDPQGQMTRVDHLKNSSDQGCGPTRQITKRCSSQGSQRQNRKNQGGRRNKNRAGSSGAA